MVIEIICSYPKTFVMGAAAMVGALSYGMYSFLVTKAKDKEHKFCWKMYIDTAWQSTLIGVVTATGIGCDWSGLFIAMLGGVGIDKITNKLKVKDTQVFNVVQLLAGLFKKK
jgi:hypothetical protein